MLVLQQLFHLSDEELEFQVNDRRSFEEFVGLGVMNSIPDAIPGAFFRERLSKAGLERTEDWWGLKNLAFNFLHYLQRTSNVAIAAKKPRRKPQSVCRFRQDLISAL